MTKGGRRGVVPPRLSSASGGGVLASRRGTSSDERVAGTNVGREQRSRYYRKRRRSPAWTKEPDEEGEDVCPCWRGPLPSRRRDPIVIGPESCRESCADINREVLIHNLREREGDFGLSLFAPLLFAEQQRCVVSGGDGTFCSMIEGREPDVEGAPFVVDEGSRHGLIPSDEEEASLENCNGLVARLEKNNRQAAPVEISTDAALSFGTQTTAAPESEPELCYATDASTTASDDDAETCQLEVEAEPAGDVEACPRVLSAGQMRQIHAALPPSLRTLRWGRAFAIGLHGDSFVSLLNRSAPHRHTLVVIRTTAGHVLGGFASEAWRIQEGFQNRHAYYGTGQSFLFCSHPDLSPSTITEGTSTGGEDQRNGEGAPLHLYPWTGTNDYCQICDVDKRTLCMGGAGDFGFIVQDDFVRGETGPCGTFGNPALVPGGSFEVAEFEIYGLAPLHAVSPASSLLPTSPFAGTPL